MVLEEEYKDYFFRLSEIDGKWLVEKKYNKDNFVKSFVIEKNRIILLEYVSELFNDTSILSRINHDEEYVPYGYDEDVRYKISSIFDYTKNGNNYYVIYKTVCNHFLCLQQTIYDDDGVLRVGTDYNNILSESRGFAL